MCAIINPIGSPVGKLYKRNTPLTLAVFLVLTFVVLGGWFSSKSGVVEERGVLSGSPPPLVNSAEGAGTGEPAVLSESQGTALLNSDQTGGGSPTPAFSGETSSGSGGTVGDPGQPIGQDLNSAGPISYKVQKGDTLPLIASYFGVSVQAIMSANQKIKGNSVSVGQKITIPAAPGADSSASESAIAAAAFLPNFNTQFIMPAQGYNWGILESDNGVDITNSCGTPVVASADGIVVPDPNISNTPDGWNGGYGNFVLLRHPFGNDIETRYANLQSVSVQVGDYVTRGRQIGLMGQTGNATRCEVHFEIIGAKNPFAQN